MEYIISAVVGYLFGCVNVAYIIGKIKGVNIKKTGTNNAGASNVFISVGKIYGVFAAIGDILKSFFAALIIYSVFDSFELAVIAGMVAVIGHIFPFWMKFNGGKGLASIMGLILFYDIFYPGTFVVMGLLLVIITLATDFIALGSVTIATVMPIFILIFDLETKKLAFWFAILMVIVWYKHRENIKRIRNKTEIGFLRKNKIKKEP